MSTASQTKIFSGDFKIRWSFNLYPNSAAKRGRAGILLQNVYLPEAVQKQAWRERQSRAAVYSSTAADKAVRWLEKEDSSTVKAACYSFFSLTALYIGGHLVKALFS
ncbi:hypothetical protein [Desulfocucumis palustris]|nr:hypothetical protein [Desulfocucumis palustris]